ncbi:MAG: hypothetical protein HY077_11365 [Elusimicrobia bacterium]|nr:hypothetical protein [Elusimicrobiota bacterium]
MRRAALIAALAALAACKMPKPPPETPVGWDVYKDGKRVLWMLDQPGTFETSAGAAPPGIPVYTHPAVTATAHDLKDEDHLRALLEASRTFDEYRATLEKNGYQVVPVGTKPPVKTP